MEMFPRHCWEKNCPHFYAAETSSGYDISCQCDILNIFIDECDVNDALIECPDPLINTYIF